MSTDRQNIMTDPISNEVPEFRVETGFADYRIERGLEPLRNVHIVGPSGFLATFTDTPENHATANDLVAAWNRRQSPAGVEPVGEAGAMPGSNGGFTMAAFEASKVPIGTKLYISPPKAVTITDEMVEQVLAWVRDDVLPAYGVSHVTFASDPEMAEGARAALTATLSSEGQSNG